MTHDFIGIIDRQYIFPLRYFFPKENFSFPGPKVGACPEGLAVI
jgi:hypothetical protein